MKRCPNCQQLFGEDMLFCLDDGTPLESDTSSEPTLVIPRGSVQTVVPEAQPARRSGGANILLFGVILLLSIAAVGFGVAYFLTARQQNDKAAVSPNTSTNTNQNERRAEQKTNLGGAAADVEKPSEEKPPAQKKPPVIGALPPSTSARTIDPPTNVRLTPNGKIQCVIREKTEITILRVPSIPDNNGLWYRTTACGGSGLIHSSQISFN